MRAPRIGSIRPLFKLRTLTSRRQSPLVSGMANWKTFMAQEDFSQIWFMDGAGKSTGWAEESAGCGSSDRSSWCGD